MMIIMKKKNSMPWMRNEQGVKKKKPRHTYQSVSASYSGQQPSGSKHSYLQSSLSSMSSQTDSSAVSVCHKISNNINEGAQIQK